MVITMPKINGYYTFTTIKPWLIFVREVVKKDWETDLFTTVCVV